MATDRHRAYTALLMRHRDMLWRMCWRRADEDYDRCCDLMQDVSIALKEAFTPSEGEEMGFVISHHQPALISAVIQDEEGRTVRRLLSRKLTRPEQLYPEGTTLYWDGKTPAGEEAKAGVYRLYIRLEQGDEVREVFSGSFRLLAQDEKPEENG